jgi:ketosteroid isomerase-like protein
MPHPNEAIIQTLAQMAGQPSAQTTGVPGQQATNSQSSAQFLQQHLAPNAIYHIPGHNPLAGTYRGTDEIAELVRRRREVLQHRHHHSTFVSTSVSDEHVAIVHQFEAEIDGQPITWRGTSVYFFEDNRIVTCWLFVDDIDAFDRFWKV